MRIVRPLMTALAGATAACALVERYMLLPPLPHAEPKSHESMPVKETSFGLALPLRRAERTVVWMPGNGYEGSHFVEKLGDHTWLMLCAFQRYIRANILFIHYRNASSPIAIGNMRGLMEDARTFMYEQGMAPETIVIGNSFGGAMALKYGHLFDPRAVYLSAPLVSLRSAATHMWPPLGNIFRYTPWLPVHTMDGLVIANEVRYPLFIVHDRNDQVIPLESVRALYDAVASKQKNLVIIDDNKRPNSHMSGYETLSFFYHYFRRNPIGTTKGV